MATPPPSTPAKLPRKPTRPKGLAHGRWLGDFETLSAAERQLVDSCARGERWQPRGWNDKLPEPGEKNSLNTIRAELIRFLMLGGDENNPLHEEAVMLEGGWIEGQLRLHQCRANLRLALVRCHFDTKPNFIAAHVPELVLSGSWMPGLNADRLSVARNLFLDDGFVSVGEVRLLGALVGMDLYCDHGTFTNKEGKALNLDGGKIGGAFFVRQSKVTGCIDLSDVSVATLVDDEDCWRAGRHILDGLRYDMLVGPTDARCRVACLKQQLPSHLNEEDWRPQPWEQLVKVLREMGHPHDAAAVAMEKQRMMRAAGRIGERQPDTHFKYLWRRKLDELWTPVSNGLARGFHDFYGWMAGYGYRPSRIVGRLVLVWFVCAGWYWAAADRFAVFGPANPVITSATLFSDAAKLCGHANELGKQRWTECSGVPDEYTTFQPLLYSLDVVLPLVDLQQERDWAPIAEGPTGKDLLAGVITRWVMWFEILFGWFASLMFVAIISRLVDRD